jgi:hypothetical protein
MLLTVNLAYKIDPALGGGDMNPGCMHWFDRVIATILMAVDRWDPTDPEILAQLQSVGSEIQQTGSVRQVLDEHRVAA